MIFSMAGTSDARELAVALQQAGYPLLCSVVTESAVYGLGGAQGAYRPSQPRADGGRAAEHRRARARGCEPPVRGGGAPYGAGGGGGCGYPVRPV